MIDENKGKTIMEKQLSFFFYSKNEGLPRFHIIGPLYRNTFGSLVGNSIALSVSTPQPQARPFPESPRFLSTMSSQKETVAIRGVAAAEGAVREAEAAFNRASQRWEKWFDSTQEFTAANQSARPCRLRSKARELLLTVRGHII